MPLTLGEIIRHVRLRHPAFSRDVVSTVVLAEACSDYQRSLIKRAAEKDRNIVVDRLSIALDLGQTNPAALLMTATKFGSVTGVPAQLSDAGKGVKLVGTVPTLDSARDLTVKYDDGLAVPAMVKFVGGTCNYSGGLGGISDPSTNPVFVGGRWGSDFNLVDFTDRLNPPTFPSGYISDGKLFLCGTTVDWTNYTGIDYRYVPHVPNLTAESDTFRLPDIFREAITARADLIAAQWAKARGRKDIDYRDFVGAAAEADQEAIEATASRARTSRTKQRNR